MPEQQKGHGRRICTAPADGLASVLGVHAVPGGDGCQPGQRECSSAGLGCRHRAFTCRRKSLRMSRALGGQPALGNGTPEQVHLTWGDDPATSVVVSWATPGRAVRPRVRIAQRGILAAERAYPDAVTRQTVGAYHAAGPAVTP